MSALATTWSDTRVLAHLLAHPIDARELLAAGAQEDLGLEPVDVVLDRGDDRVPGIGQRVEDAVDEVVLGLGVLRDDRAVEVVEQVALVLAHREDVVAGHVDVDLERCGDGLAGARAPGGEEDDQDV